MAPPVVEWLANERGLRGARISRTMCGVNRGASVSGHFVLTLDPAEHLLGVAIGREHRIEDLLDDAIAHDQGETLQQRLPSSAEDGQSERVCEPQIGVAEERKRQEQ